MKLLNFGLSILILGASSLAIAHELIDQLSDQSIELIGLSKVDISAYKANCSRDQINKSIYLGPSQHFNGNYLMMKNDSLCESLKFKGLMIYPGSDVQILFSKIRGPESFGPLTVNNLIETRDISSWAKCSVRSISEDPSLLGFANYEITNEIIKEEVLDCELTTQGDSGHVLFKINSKALLSDLLFSPHTN